MPWPNKSTLIWYMHKEFGHIEVHWIHSMLYIQYSWTVIYVQVAIYVGKCKVCECVGSSFNTLSP